IVRAPDKAGIAVPDETSLAAAIRAGSAGPVTAYVDRIASSTLLDTLPEPSPVDRASGRGALGVTDGELGHGAKVGLKPPAVRQDEILFRAFSRGGTSQASEADYVPASTATQVITAGGLGRFSSADLRRVLTGKIASANPTISELEEGMFGSASPK